MGTSKKLYILTGVSLMVLGVLLSFYTMARANGTYKRFLPAIQKAETIQCTSGLNNPGFEYILQCWAAYSTQGGNDILTSMVYHPGTGFNSARLGSSVENNRQAWISQDVYVPVERPILSYWHYVDSLETYCPQYSDYDYVRIFINDDLDNPVKDYELCNDGKLINRAWVKQVVDLYAYRGRIVNLKIYFKSDVQSPSDFYIDDLRFE